MQTRCAFVVLTIVLQTISFADIPRPWQPFIICDSKNPETFPEIDGNRVAWEAYTNYGDWDIQGADINNVDPEYIKILTIAGTPQDEWAPDISGSIVVHERKFTNYPDYDIWYTTSFSDNPELFCIDSSPDDTRRPRVSGSNVTWMHKFSDANDWDIILITLPDHGEESTMTALPITYGDEIFPDLNGNRIIWTWVENQESGYITSMDPTTDPNTIFVGMQLNPEHAPVISGNWVVGVDIDGFVIADNISDDEEALKISRSRYCGSPAIADHIVVWHDWRNDNWDLYGYNLEKQSEFKIVASCVGNQRHPDITACPDGDGYWVVWEDDREGQWNTDIYGMRINGPKVARVEE